MYKMNNSTQSYPLSLAQSPPFNPKKTPITDDYEISNDVLGLGINGKVVVCYAKSSGIKYALKVSNKIMINSGRFALVLKNYHNKPIKWKK
jgi:hypothetical protein